MVDFTDEEWKEITDQWKEKDAKCMCRMKGCNAILTHPMEKAKHYCGEHM